MLTKTTMNVESTVYANAATTYAGSKPEHWDSGVVVYNTLPASDWNWMWNYVTSNLKEGASDLSSLIDEFVALGEAIGVTVEADTSLTDVVNAYVTRIATATTPGAILSSDEDYYISVDESGYASVNGLDTLVSNIDTLTTDVSSLRESVDALDTDVDTLNTNVETLTENTTTLSESVSSLNEDVTTLLTIQSSLQEDVATLLLSISDPASYATHLSFTDGSIVFSSDYYTQGDTQYEYPENKIFYITGDVTLTDHTYLLTVEEEVEVSCCFDSIISYGGDADSGFSDDGAVYAPFLVNGTLNIVGPESHELCVVGTQFIQYLAIILLYGSVTISGGTNTSSSSTYSSSRSYSYLVYNYSTGSVTISGGTNTSSSTTSAYSYSRSYSYLVYNYSTGSVTISGGTNTSSSSSSYYSYSSYSYLVYNYSIGSVTISGGTNTSSSAGASYYSYSSRSYLVYNYSTGSVTISGGTNTSSSSTRSAASSAPYSYLVYNYSTGSVTISGGTNTSSSFCIGARVDSKSLYSYLVYNCSTGSVTISGGTNLINPNGSLQYAGSTAYLYLYGYLVYAASSSATVLISGGLFVICGITGDYVSRTFSICNISYTSSKETSFLYYTSGSTVGYPHPTIVGSIFSFSCTPSCSNTSLPVGGDITIPCRLSVSFESNITFNDTLTILPGGFVELCSGYTLTGNIINKGSFILLGTWDSEG